MTDLDPEIWNNPTLGAAAKNPRLDVIEAQEIEDRAAKIEGREPLEVVAENDYPGWTPPVDERTGTTPSNFNVLQYVEEPVGESVEEPVVSESVEEPVAEETPLWGGTE